VPDWLTQVLRGLGASTRHNALAYGYSLALAGTYGILDVVDGSPTPADILLFGVGGTTTFTLATIGTTRGFRKRTHDHAPAIQAIGSSFGFLSVTAAIGCAWLLAWLIAGGWVAWVLAPFVASFVYLFGSAIELALAQVAQERFDVELEDPKD
jgi:hypothetical protein